MEKIFLSYGWILTFVITAVELILCFGLLGRYVKSRKHAVVYMFLMALGLVYDAVIISIGRFMDMDNPSNYKEGEPGAETGTLGSVTDGALALTGRVCDWWDWEKDEGKSLIIGFSTAGIEGSVLYFAWSFAGGRLSQQTSALYPSWWQVSWSTDGVNFTAVPESLANMHSLPYSAGEYDGKSYETSAEAGIGYTEHLCELPKSLFGCKKVFVKLSPARKVAASMSYLHRDNMEIYPELTEKCYVNFGEISVRYR